jgi:hypothetical protein
LWEKKISGMLKPVYGLLGFALGLVVIIILASLDIASSISTDLTTAATTAAGFLVLIALLAAIKYID